MLPLFSLLHTVEVRLDLGSIEIFFYILLYSQTCEHIPTIMVFDAGLTVLSTTKPRKFP